ncbi:MAG: hypothetical protein H0T62_12830 [Parachlamydiaceae bacterium]|nr:hypothetical protein [Parachlamydiaceae bacterium]
MDEKTKRKMCWNCEGNISLEEDVCPYCRAAIIPRGEEFSNKEVSQKTDSSAFIGVTMALLMGGCFFSLFGILLFFFSDSGFFTLRWSDRYSTLYIVIAFTMLYFGFRNLQKLPSEK